VWQSIAYYGGLLVESVFGVFGIRLYEEPRYTVIDHIGYRVEIRRYTPRLAAEVDLISVGDVGRREAFQLLFGYIAGANRASTLGRDNLAMTTPVEVRSKELVAMTVPVETSDSAGSGRMRFFLPAKYTLDTAPKPLNPRVRLVKVSEETIAALRFSGSTSDIVERMAELMGRFANAKWRPDGEPYTLLYDAPFTVSFLRRNEAAVAVVRLP
jgi:hypothetical protein